jgi:hypothetical protein
MQGAGLKTVQSDAHAVSQLHCAVDYYMSNDINIYRMSCLSNTASTLGIVLYVGLQLEEWVCAFPTQCVILVDAVVWTQSATVALMKAARGDRNSLRHLLDQTAMRLEGLGKALRTVQATAAACKQHDEDDASVISDVGDDSIACMPLPTVTAAHSINSLKGLISAGVAHRQVRHHGSKTCI